MKMPQRVAFVLQRVIKCGDEELPPKCRAGRHKERAKEGGRVAERLWSVPCACRRLQTAHRNRE